MDKQTFDDWLNKCGVWERIVKLEDARKNLTEDIKNLKEDVKNLKEDKKI